MYRLYYAPGTSSVAPHAALEEIGADYELVSVELSRDKPRDPEYLALNPNGLVPTLVDENGPVYEAAAIMIHLADRHPEAGLAPPSGDAARGRYFQWLVYMADTLQVAYQMHYLPHRHSTDPDHIPAIRAKGAERLAMVWGHIEAAMDPGPYLLGERFSGCDLYTYMLTNWHPDKTRLFEACPRLARCVDLVTRRPAVRRMMEANGLA